MRAAVIQGPGQPLVVEVRDDPTPGPGELVVDVAACGICGSDLHLAEHVGLPGVVLGHEFAGEVVATGAGVEGFAEGDAVCGFPLVACGACPACVAGSPAHCATQALIGFQRPGAYADFVTMPARDAWALPPGVPPATGALVEPMAVGLHAVDSLAREPDEPVLVLGGGPVGQAVSLWLRTLGAPVVLSDPVEHRRAMAERLGAAATVDPTRDDVRAVFEGVTGRPPGAVVECVGVPGLIQHAVDVAGPEARITVVGVCMQPDTLVPIVAVMKEIAMKFVVYYRRTDFDRTVAAIASGDLDPTPLVTDEIGLDDLPERFEALKHPTTECKVLVRP